jgi:hypothetical protein
MTLDGKKTYITAAVLGLASFALAMGWLDKAQYQVIVGLLGSLGLAALRSGVAKTGPERPQEAGAEQTLTMSEATSVAEGTVGGNA